LRKLVVISHTEHQLNEDGIIVGWASTVNEINFLAGYFDEVVHVACLENSQAKGSSVPYTAQNVKFQSIPAFGGKTLLNKLGVVLKAPQILIKVQKALKNATHVQLRLPTSIGIFLLPYFSLRNKKRYIFWVKYANNWVQPNPPLSYRLQRWFLVSNLADCKVTINGAWPGQLEHCITFGNPCLSRADRVAGCQALQKKILKPPFKLVFVGRVEEKKGIFILIEALQFLKAERIHSLTILGSGEGDSLAKELSRRLNIPVYFLGDVTQLVVHNILENAHFLVLPSYSEGFPKVAAEAMNYGCIPILSKVGSIPYYLEDGLNSFLLEKIEVKSLLKVFQRVYTLEQNKLHSIQNIGYLTADLFTFERYIAKLESTIFEVKKAII
jgi:glycosyltransferase involved in cell wall biosynthesis